jgi:hypothetical protein
MPVRYMSTYYSTLPANDMPHARHCDSQVVRGAVQVFKRTKSGQGNGTVGKLTANVVTRAAYYEHAVMMALIPFMNPDLYPEYGLVLDKC